MPKVKVGFVGVGFMGQLAHLSQYVRWPELCDVVAISDLRYEMANEVGRRYGIPNVYRSHKEMFANEKLDAVVAPQPYGHHRAIIPEVLKEKIPLFTEKPLALSVEAGQELVDLAAKDNILYMVGYHKRSDPAMEYAKMKVRDWQKTGVAGKMRMVRVQMPPGNWVSGAPAMVLTEEPYPPIVRETTVPGFDEEHATAYDVFVNYYIHQVNALRFFLGDISLSYADPSGVMLAVHNQEGVCGSLEMATYNTSNDWQEKVFIGFEKGYIKVDLTPPLADRNASRITIMEDYAQQIITQPILPPLSAMTNQARNFLLAVRGERPAPCIAAEAVKDLQLARDYIRMLG